MKALASSVVRLTSKGADHGYLYLVDFDTEAFKPVLKWSDENIDWEGRGGDRGLRGIAFYKEHIIVASGKQILFLNSNYTIEHIFNHPFLGDIHELFVDGNTLYITSTLYDLILALDLDKLEFTNGYFIISKTSKPAYQKLFHKKWIAFRKKILYPINTQSIAGRFKFSKIDLYEHVAVPNTNGTGIHINTVFIWKNTICFTGTQHNILYGIVDGSLQSMGTIPFGTHNVKPLNDKRLMLNYTLDESIIITNWKGFKKDKYPIYYNKENITGNYASNYAKAGWGRGLDVKENYFIAGCSPATVNLYKFGNKKPITSIQFDTDIRNSIHGLAFLPDNFS